MGTNKNSCKTAAVMNLLSRSAAERVLPAQPKEAPARDIEVITSEILDAKRRAGENILTIGRGLIEAKAMLSHGEWLPWLTERVEFSEKSAQNFMRIARNYSNPQTLADLGASKALMLLALPEASREEFIGELHEVGGEEKSVVDMSARELQAALKERDEALKAAEQARAEQTAAEQARDKMAQDMAVANERIAGLNAEVEQRAAEARDRADEAARLERELEELRSRPVDVAVQVDEEAVAAARREAEEAMRAQLDAAKKAQAQAEEALKRSEEDKAAAQKKVEQANAQLQEAQAEAQAVREQMVKAEKKTALTANADMVLFNELFSSAQQQVNRMGGIVLKVGNKDPEAAGKLRTALLALVDVVKGAAG